MASKVAKLWIVKHMTIFIRDG